MQRAVANLEGGDKIRLLSKMRQQNVLALSSPLSIEEASRCEISLWYPPILGKKTIITLPLIVEGGMEEGERGRGRGARQASPADHLPLLLCTKEHKRG